MTTDIVRLRPSARIAAIMLLAASVLMGACSSDDSAGGDGADSLGVVVATTSQIGALVHEVAGDRVTIETLLAPGVDPHDYEPSAQEIAQVADADLVLRNGIGLDAFLDDSIDGTDAPVVTVTEGITLREGGEHEDEEHEEDEDHDEHEEGDGHDHGEFDPHVWHDPANVQVMVENIVVALSETFPAEAATFREHGDAYIARLDEVDAEIQALIEEIPVGQRKLVTAHDSLGYFLDRYGLELVGAVTPSMAPGAEVSARELADLQAVIEAEGVRAIFAEGSVDPSIAEQLAADTGVKIVTDLYGDSMGEAGSDGETIDGMLLHNARRISEALK